MSQLISLEPKDPQDVKDYRVSWVKWLRPDETLTDSDWTVQDGLNKVADPVSGVVDPFTNTDSIVWVSGGTAGSFTARVHVTTSQGRQQDKTITIQVRDL